MFQLIVFCSVRWCLILLLLRQPSRMAWAYGVSECVVLLSTLVAYAFGEVCRGWRAWLVGCCYLVPLLFRPGVAPGWFQMTAVAWFSIHAALRVQMFGGVTVGGPCFVRVCDRGPYGLLRHPMAVCELLSAAFCCVAWWSLWNVVVMVCCVVAGVVACLVEENYLFSFAGYRHYAAQVRWRWFPGVW